MAVRPNLVLTVGLPGAGKTTLVRQLADERRILRFSPDEWMAPLFHDGEADGRRDILEGRMIWTAYEVLRSGASAFWTSGVGRARRGTRSGQSRRLPARASNCGTSPLPSRSDEREPAGGGRRALIRHF